MTSHRVGLTQVSVIGPSEGVWLRLPLTGAVTYSLSLAPRPKRTVFGGHDPVVLRGGMGAKPSQPRSPASSRSRRRLPVPTSGVGFG